MESYIFREVQFVGGIMTCRFLQTEQIAQREHKGHVDMKYNSSDAAMLLAAIRRLRASDCQASIAGSCGVKTRSGD